MPFTPSVPDVIGPKCMLGEGPVWDPITERLFWVDAARKQMFSLDAEAGAIRKFELEGYPGSYAFCEVGEVLMAYRHGLAIIDLGTGAHRAIETPQIDFANARFNDGVCDRAGRFWVGTMHKAMREPVGALFRVDTDLTIHTMAEGLMVSNGLAFAPDDSVMYCTDSGASAIYAYDFDLASGAIRNRRLFADFSAGKGRPDGCTVDRNGCLWVAVLGEGRVAVLDPDGAEVRSLHLPTDRPTSVSFGGKALDILYVTSMQHALSEEELAVQPDAGAVFAFAGVGTGLPEPRFGGR